MCVFDDHVTVTARNNKKKNFLFSDLTSVNIHLLSQSIELTFRNDQKLYLSYMMTEVDRAVELLAVRRPDLIDEVQTDRVKSYHILKKDEFDSSLDFFNLKSGWAHVILLYGSPLALFVWYLAAFSNYNIFDALDVVLISSIVPILFTAFSSHVAHLPRHKEWDKQNVLGHRDYARETRVRLWCAPLYVVCFLSMFLGMDHKLSAVEKVELTGRSSSNRVSRSQQVWVDRRITSFDHGDSVLIAHEGKLYRGQVLTQRRSPGSLLVTIQFSNTIKEIKKTQVLGKVSGHFLSFLF